MAAVLSPAADQGYIKTVLGYKHFVDLDSSSLALPSEERLKTDSRGQLDKSLRIQQQVQLTMARKKGGSSNGNIHRAVSVPDQVLHSATVTKKLTASSSAKNYDTIKTIPYENGYSRSRAQYSQWKYEGDATAQRRPMVRVEVSPERARDVTAYDGRTSVGRSPWYGTVGARYARSEIVGHGKARQSVAHRFYSGESGHDSVFLTGAPNSPASHLHLQSRNSRSMNNLVENDLYRVPPGAVGQVRSLMSPVSGKGQSVRSRWQESTVRSTFSGRESIGGAGGGMDVGGRRGIVTTGMAGGGGTAIAHVRSEGALAGNVQVVSEVDLTLERAINILKDEASSPQWTAAAASFIQHECFQKSEARRRVFVLGGIPRLLRLLSSDNEDVQRAAAAALRNLVFEDNDNKLEVCDQRGLSTLLQLLRETQDLETKRQITGLLWNLSSNDQLKPQLIREALSPLTRNTVIPGSGWSEGDNPKSGVLTDSDIFYNATGCLRNMSSAGPEGRKSMRECDGLIDALVYYARRSIADYRPDDKAAENCVCILHNLSYQLEAELPSACTQNIFTPRRDALADDQKSVGCFGSRSRKIKETWQDTPMTEEKSNPRGVEWLWHSIVLRMYLSLIAKSSRNYTQEASLGALQNLTAGNGPMPVAVAQTVVQRENGPQHIRNMLHSSDPGVKRTAVSLLRNLSRNRPLQSDIAKDLLPDLVNLLPDSLPDSNVANETAASVCYVLSNLVSDSSQNARALLNSGGVRKLVNLSMSDSNMNTKTGRVASVVLYSMWQHQDQHGAYKKAMFKKADFVNSRTSKAYHSL
ncbi:plakophilin-2 [Spea bombifrons]|uniref:plakophilin-2 n=1 Tax=Spea bombifrons TaxID=233779 RepID=UPI00234BDEAB|nr:plakophilin-2 [Spea bombifrons]